MAIKIKKESQSKTSSESTRAILDFFSHYNMIVFVTLVVCGLTAVVLVLSNIVTTPYTNPTSLDNGNSNPTTTTVTDFDEATVTALNALKTSGQNTVSELPSGRINPFSE